MTKIKEMKNLGNGLYISRLEILEEIRDGIIRSIPINLDKSRNEELVYNSLTRSFCIRGLNTEKFVIYENPIHISSSKDYDQLVSIYTLISIIEKHENEE